MALIACRAAGRAAALLGLAAALAPAAGHAAAGAAGTAAACPPRQAPRVRVEVLDPEPSLAADLGMEALRAAAGPARRPRGGRAGTAHHLGLTTSRVEWQGEIELRYARPPSAGRTGGRSPAPLLCAVPGAVTLRLSQAEHRIRIAREIPRGSCLFREVEAHERRHAAVNRQTLRAAAGEARRAAEAWAATAEARGATLAEAMAKLRHGLRRAVEPALVAMRAARERGHGAIDTPAEYRRLAGACPADQRVLRERLRGLRGD